MFIIFEKHIITLGSIIEETIKVVIHLGGRGVFIYGGYLTCVVIPPPYSFQSCAENRYNAKSVGNGSWRDSLPIYWRVFSQAVLNGDEGTNGCLCT